MNTQTRIALVFFLITFGIIVLLSGAVYYFVTEYTFSDFYKRLETRAVLSARITLKDESIPPDLLQEMRNQILEKLPQEEDYIFEITPGATFEQESDSLRLPVSFFKEIARGAVGNVQQGSIFFSGIRFEINNKAYLSVVSAENYFYSHHISNLRRVFVVAIVSLSLLVLYVSFVFSRHVFKPVRQITQQVKEIGSQNLHMRLNVSDVTDEVSELKNTFNTMLDRLEAAFATQNNFISNASHELRTPLTGIIGEADVALSKDRSVEVYKEALGAILKEAERLERITRSLLFLAQTGFDGKKQKMEVLRADQLLWDVKETIDKLNPGNKVHLDLTLIPEESFKLKILGNAQLLHLAISNIVSNACKYSSNKPVKISIGTTQDQVNIVVKDSGIGIPEQELGYIYDPFFRASNTRNFEGYGIGLPLARNIVRVHGGTISVSSEVNEGTTVRLAFPLKTIQPE